MSVKSNLEDIVEKIASYDCTLVAVSKTKPIELIREALECGHLDFGENRVQELKEKAAILQDQEINWHQIGHLQRNKVKYIAPFVHLIHAVDSPRILKEISKQATKTQREINCLLEVHIAQESSKFGFSFEELDSFLATFDTDDYPNVKLSGLMGMASFSDDQSKVQGEFESLRRKFVEVQEANSVQLPFITLSMGMSGDYQIALDAGSNMIRVGSAIFGSR